MERKLPGHFLQQLADVFSASEQLFLEALSLAAQSVLCVQLLSDHLFGRLPFRMRAA